MKIFNHTYSQYAKQDVTEKFEILQDRMGGKYEFTTDISDADLILAIGGDGTIISAKNMAIDNNIPIVGFNRGTLGFLACSSSITDLYTNLIVEHNFSVKDRSMLELTLYKSDSKTNTPEIYRALNEFTLENSARGKLLELSLKVGSDRINYSADKLIFATTSGSTAYNLSAGGSLVHPSMDCILITPVAPFSMSSRPIILPSHLIFDIIHTYDLCVSIDGVNIDIKQDDEFSIGISNKKLHLVSFGDHFIRSITDKLNWNNQIKK